MARSSSNTRSSHLSIVLLVLFNVFGCTGWGLNGKRGIGGGVGGVLTGGEWTDWAACSRSRVRDWVVKRSKSE